MCQIKNNNSKVNFSHSNSNSIYNSNKKRKIRENKVEENLVKENKMKILIQLNIQKYL